MLTFNVAVLCVYMTGLFGDSECITQMLEDFLCETFFLFYVLFFLPIHSSCIFPSFSVWIISCFSSLLSLKLLLLLSCIKFFLLSSYTDE